VNPLALELHSWCSLQNYGFKDRKERKGKEKRKGKKEQMGK